MIMRGGDRYFVRVSAFKQRNHLQKHERRDAQKRFIHYFFWFGMHDCQHKASDETGEGNYPPIKTFQLAKEV
jgi:hypothetical protein